MFSGLAIILSAHTIWGHLRQYSAPRLQKYIVRILLLVPIYAGCSFLETVYPAAAVNFTTARELYEAYTLFNFIRFLMVSAFHSGNNRSRVLLLSDLSVVGNVLS